MTRVVKPLLGLAALGLAAALVVKVLLPRLEDRKTGPAPVAPPAGPDRVERQRFLDADDLTAPDLFREAVEAADSRTVLAELRGLKEERAAAAQANLARRVEDLLNEYRFTEASHLVQRYRTAWGGTRAGAAMAGLLDEVRSSQRDQVAARREEAIALVEAGRYLAARESLKTEWTLEPEFRTKLDETAEEIERRIRVHAYNAGKPPPAPRPGPERPGAVTVRATPTSPPPLPGFPHPDVKRLGEARALLAQANKLFNGRKYQPAAEAMGNLVGYYGDLKYVARKREAVGALEALARHGAKGVAGLFNATKVSRKGKKIRLTYTFESDAEYLDWEELPTVPHGGDGDVKRVRNGIQLNGVTTYLLRAWFENDVEIRAVSKPQRHKSHGLALCQKDEETRQLLWLVCNHWFVEGENYVKKRPGHSLIMIGKGVNADVPVDSPDVGFIFRGPSITEPDPPGGASFKIAWSLRKDTMAGEIEYKGKTGSLKGSTVGDDGRSIERTRPGVFTVDNSVVFRQIVIEGKLHPSFESGRVNDLLHLASMLEFD